MPTLIDPDQIYPKRIGIYQGALIIEYYNISKDCFKKHLIPYDDRAQPSKIVEGILKNSKHSVYLRKVAPQHLEAVIRGSANILPLDINERIRTSEHKISNNKNSLSIESNYISGSHLQPSSSFSSNLNSRTNEPDPMNHEESQEYSMKFENEDLSVSYVPKKQDKKVEHVIEEELEYYDEQFEEISGDEVQNKSPPPKPSETKQQKPEPNMKKKEKKKKVEPNLDEFQFLDEDEQKRKKKKKKKKEKSKQKSNVKSKDTSNKSSEPSKEVSVAEEIPIQQEFDFI